MYKILTSYIYLYAILLLNRDKIKGYLPKLKTDFFPFLFLQKEYINGIIIAIGNAQ